MATSVYFSGAVKSEQDLYEDLVTESIKIFGQDVVYLPREQVSEDDLLNETAQGSTNTQTANAPVNMAQPFSSGAPLPTDTTGMPDSVASAMTRDYSGLMKAINKKKQ